MSLSFALPALPTAASMKDFLVRKLFTRTARIQLYETLGLLLDNGIAIREALTEVYKTEAGQEFKPRQPPPALQPVAVVVYDCITAVDSGRQLSDAFALWVSPLEVSLIEAGEKIGNYLIAFERAQLALTKQAELSGAVRKAMAYPIGLALLIAGLFGFLGFSFAPQLLVVQPIEKWDPSTGDMLSKGVFVADHWLLLTVLTVVIVGSTVYSLGHLTGRIRDRLDRLPPWSIYRLFYGSVFMLNVAVMLNCGIGLEDALMMLNQRSNAYMKERITHTLKGVRTGRTFGDALKDAEHNFPSAKAVSYIQILSNKQGFDQALERFTLRSLDLNIKEIESAAGMLRIIGLAAAGYALQLIATGLIGITSSAQAFAK